MANLAVKYLGLELKNPFIVSSCGLTRTVRGIRPCAAAGASAIVLESLFEEQIDAELGVGGAAAASISDEIAVHPEAADYLNELGKSYAPHTYLELIQQAKSEFDIPVIASVNCVSARWWSDYARQIETAGADALELNIALMPRRIDQEAAGLESRVYDIVQGVREQVSLPITVKIGPYFTSLPRVISRITAAGANGVVLFNRFYQLDIDPETEELVAAYQFSSEHEIYQPLRWISILAPQVQCDISASTGIHSGLAAAKMILAGANVVQVASVLYTRKVKHLTAMIDEFDAWMERRGYATVAEARGHLMQSKSYDPEALERLQYIKALTGAG